MSRILKIFCVITFSAQLSLELKQISQQDFLDDCSAQGMNLQTEQIKQSKFGSINIKERVGDFEIKKKLGKQHIFQFLRKSKKGS